jgi:GT2 family glycosyltransferase
VSVVVSTYRREPLLCAMLGRLLEALPEDTEILVVDQTPEPGPALRALLAAAGERIRYLRQAEPSLPRARNAGWRAARGEIVLYLDDDVIPSLGLLEAHRAAYRAPDVGGVAGRVITRGAPLPERPAWKSRLPGVGWLFFNFAQTAACDVWTARGCHMSFRRALLEALGGFDERYVQGPAFREETDLCFRLRRRGLRLAFEPSAVVEHLMHEEGGERTVHRDAAMSPTYHANGFYFFWKNVPVRHRPLTFLVLLIQEMRRRPHRPPRTLRERGRVLGLFLRGALEGWRRARGARRGAG